MPALDIGLTHYTAHPVVNAAESCNQMMRLSGGSEHRACLPRHHDFLHRPSIATSPFRLMFDYLNHVPNDIAEITNGISNTGFTLIYEPEENAASPMVDIVIVHGL